jgi:F1F0 ATPase subunit 2
MDEERMSYWTSDSLPTWAMLLGLAAQLALGIVLGVVHFGGLWWNVRRFAGAGRVTTTIALMIGRVVLLAGMLTLAGREGVLPLLVMALGVTISRSLVMRRVRAAVP